MKGKSFVCILTFLWVLFSGVPSLQAQESEFDDLALKGLKIHFHKAYDARSTDTFYLLQIDKQGERNVSGFEMYLAAEETGDIMANAQTAKEFLSYPEKIPSDILKKMKEEGRVLVFLGTHYEPKVSRHSDHRIFRTLSWDHTYGLVDDYMVNTVQAFSEYHHPVMVKRYEP